MISNAIGWPPSGAPMYDDSTLECSSRELPCQVVRKGHLEIQSLVSQHLGRYLGSPNDSRDWASLGPTTLVALTSAVSHRAPMLSASATKVAS